MLFGCKLSLAMVSNSVRIRSSDRLPSEGTSVEVVELGIDVDADVDVDADTDTAEGTLGSSPQAANPTTRLTVMINRFTPVRLCVHEQFVAQST
jgi:hypothetical protein